MKVDRKFEISNDSTVTQLLQFLKVPFNTTEIFLNDSLLLVLEKTLKDQNVKDGDKIYIFGYIKGG